MLRRILSPFTVLSLLVGLLLAVPVVTGAVPSADATTCPAAKPAVFGFGVANSGGHWPVGATADFYGSFTPPNGVILGQNIKALVICGPDKGQSFYTRVGQLKNTATPSAYAFHFPVHGLHGVGTDVVSVSVISGAVRPGPVTVSLTWVNPINCTAIPGFGYRRTLVASLGWGATVECTAARVAPLLAIAKNTFSCLSTIASFAFPAANLVKVITVLKDVRVAVTAGNVAKAAGVANTAPVVKLVLDLNKLRTTGVVTLAWIQRLFGNGYATYKFADFISNFVVLIHAIGTDKAFQDVEADIWKLLGVDSCLTLVAEVTRATSLPNIISTSFATATVGQPYSANLTISDTRSGTWGASSTLPPGLAVSGHTLSGTPTSAGTYKFWLTFQSSTGNASVATSVLVAAAQSPAPSTTSCSSDPLGPAWQSFAMSSCLPHDAAATPNAVVTYGSCGATVCTESGYYTALSGATENAVWMRTQDSTWTVVSFPAPPGASVRVDCGGGYCLAGLTANYQLSLWAWSSATGWTASPSTSQTLDGYQADLLRCSASGCAAFGATTSNSSASSWAIVRWSPADGWRTDTVPFPADARSADPNVGLMAASCGGAACTAAFAYYRGDGGVSYVLATATPGAAPALFPLLKPSAATADPYSVGSVSCGDTICAAEATYSVSTGLVVTFATWTQAGGWDVQPAPAPDDASGVTTPYGAASIACGSVCGASGSYVNMAGTVVPVLWNLTASGWSVQSRPLPADAVATGAVYSAGTDYQVVGGGGFEYVGDFTCGGATCTLANTYIDSANVQHGLIWTWTPDTGWTWSKVPQPADVPAGTDVTAVNDTNHAVSCSAVACATAGTWWDGSPGWENYGLSWTSHSGWVAQDLPTPVGASVATTGFFQCSSFMCTAYVNYRAGDSTVVEIAPA